VLNLTSEAVQGSSLALQSVDDVHGSDGLSLGVLGVGDGVANDVLQEHLENTSRLLVDEPGDTLDTTSACQATDGRLGYALNVVSQDLPVSLCTSLS